MKWPAANLVRVCSEHHETASAFLPHVGRARVAKLRHQRLDCPFSQYDRFGALVCGQVPDRCGSCCHDCVRAVGVLYFGLVHEFDQGRDCAIIDDALSKLGCNERGKDTGKDDHKTSIKRRESLSHWHKQKLRPRELSTHHRQLLPGWARANAHRRISKAIFQQYAESTCQLLRLIQQVRNHRSHAALVDD